MYTKPTSLTITEVLAVQVTKAAAATGRDHHLETTTQNQIEAVHEYLFAPKRHELVLYKRTLARKIQPCDGKTLFNLHRCSRNGFTRGATVGISCSSSLSGCRWSGVRCRSRVCGAGRKRPRRRPSSCVGGGCSCCWAWAAWFAAVLAAT